MSKATTKACPFCAETIQAAAAGTRAAGGCRFCGRDLPGAAAGPALLPDRLPAGEPAASSLALDQTEIFDVLSALVQKSLAEECLLLARELRVPSLVGTALSGLVAHAPSYEEALQRIEAAAREYGPRAVIHPLGALGHRALSLADAVAFALQAREAA